MRVSTILLFALALLLGSAQAGDLRVGQPAPAFELPDQHGETHRLADYADGWLVLYFYPKNETPGCTTEACNFRDAMHRLIAQDTQILGVSMDSQASHQAFAEKYELPFSLLSDPDGVTVRDYGALSNFLVVRFAKRHSFIIDPDGRLAKIYRDVDPDEHVFEVLADLRQLRAQVGTTHPDP